MKVVKIGGGSLKGRKTTQEILDLVAERGPRHVLVVSAFGGITDQLIDSTAKALKDEEAVPPIIGELRNTHRLAARHVVGSSPFMQKYAGDLHALLGKVERFTDGLNFTPKITPKVTDGITGSRERLSADLLSTALGRQRFASSPQTKICKKRFKPFTPLFSENAVRNSAFDIRCSENA